MYLTLGWHWHNNMTFKWFTQFNVNIYRWCISGCWFWFLNISNFSDNLRKQIVYLIFLEVVLWFFLDNVIFQVQTTSLCFQPPILNKTLKHTYLTKEITPIYCYIATILPQQLQLFRAENLKEFTKSMMVTSMSQIQY